MIGCTTDYKYMKLFDLKVHALNARKQRFHPKPLLFRYYLLALTIVPVLFYIPKFFEVRTDDVIITQQGSDSLLTIFFIKFYHLELEPCYD